MLKICSKYIISMYPGYPGGQMLLEDHFKRIRHQIFNADPYGQKEDSGQNKKNTTPAITWFGSNDRQNNPGAGMGLERDVVQFRSKGIGSGYNDGEQAQDEVGPGNTSVSPNPYYATDVFNDVFLDLRLKYPSDNILGNLNKIKHTKLSPPHNRFQVNY